MKRTVLVVGAAGGIGGQIVAQLLARGDRVIATVLNAEEAARVPAAVEKTVLLDLADADNIVSTLERQNITNLDAVVVCAAISPYGPLAIASLAVLRKTLEINTVSHVAVYQATLPLLRATKGRLLLVSSFAGRVGLPFIGSYTASKFALEGLADVMRREAAEFGVKVIVVEPGGVKTPMVLGQLEGITRDREKLSPAQEAQYGKHYANFRGVIQKNWDTMLDPSVPAAAIIEALGADAPLARYPVGEDSKFLCEAARKTDAEVDAIVASFASA